MTKPHKPSNPGAWHLTNRPDFRDDASRELLRSMRETADSPMHVVDLLGTEGGWISSQLSGKIKAVRALYDSRARAMYADADAADSLALGRLAIARGLVGPALAA